MKKVKDSGTWKKSKKVEKFPDLPTGIPKLVLTAYAHQKLCYWEALSKKDEVSCFGIATNPKEPLRITELYLPEQEVTGSSTDPTEDGIAKLFEEMEDLKLKPVQFFRVWIHTHPFKSSPSKIDFSTCQEVLGKFDWFIMLIKGSDGFTCYLYVMGAMPVRLSIEVVIDYSNPGLPSKILKNWTKTFTTGVIKEKLVTKSYSNVVGYSGGGHWSPEGRRYLTGGSDLVESVHKEISGNVRETLREPRTLGAGT